jgi:hypothetical protein
MNYELGRREKREGRREKGESIKIISCLLNTDS